MGYLSKFLGITAAVMFLSVSVVGAEEKDPLKPRVPPDQAADAKALKNPVASSPESIAKGERRRRSRPPPAAIAVAVRTWW